MFEFPWLKIKDKSGTLLKNGLNGFSLAVSAQSTWTRHGSLLILEQKSLREDLCYTLYAETSIPYARHRG